MQQIEASMLATQRAPLLGQISTLLKESTATPVDFFASIVIVPNTPSLAGGVISADVYKSLSAINFDSVISIAPSGIGEFKRITACSLDQYASPLGDVPVDDRVRNELCDEDDDIFLDDKGHFNHTGLDVQLPFLQSVLGQFSVVPLIMGSETVDFCKELGSAVGEIMFNRNTLVVVCVDILRATPRGMKLFNKALNDLDVPRMMTLLNQENEILVQGKGGVLAAMIAATHRRSTRVHVCDMAAPNEGTHGFVGALIGRG
jgi:MEMO1 family protein